MDWWAFGVLVYEMLAGYPPFYEEDTAQTYQRILHGRFTFPAGFPVTVRDLVRKLLQVRAKVAAEEEHVSGSGCRWICLDASVAGWRK